MAAYGTTDFGFPSPSKASVYGVDGFSTPQILAFGVELLGRLLTDEDFAAARGTRRALLLDAGPPGEREAGGATFWPRHYWAPRPWDRSREVTHNNIKKHEQLPSSWACSTPCTSSCTTNEKISIPRSRATGPGAFPTRCRKSARGRRPQRRTDRYRGLKEWSSGGRSHPYYPPRDRSEIVD